METMGDPFLCSATVSHAQLRPPSPPCGMGCKLPPLSMRPVYVCSPRCPVFIRNPNKCSQRNGSSRPLPLVGFQQNFPVALNEVGGMTKRAKSRNCPPSDPGLGKIGPSLKYVFPENSLHVNLHTASSPFPHVPPPLATNRNSIAPKCFNPSNPLHQKNRKRNFPR